MERREEEEDEEQKKEEARAGAGGKMTRRPFRLRAPPTPYDRPPAAGGKERREGDGWVSKILVRPASTIIPSLFSPSPSAASNQDYPPLSESFLGTRQDDADRVSSPDNQVLQAKDRGVFAEKSQPFGDPEVHQLSGDEARNVCDSGGIAEVISMLNLLFLCREQSNCLMKLLLSRTRDLSHDNRPAAGFVTKADGTLNLKAPRKSAQSAVLPEQRITPKPREASEMRVAHDVGSSPVEIAKAYMEALANESNHNSHDGRLELEKATFDNCASASDMSYSSDVKLPICWPGAFVESSYRYHTPQTHRTKVEPYKFQRTPYYGSNFSRSKFQAGDQSPQIVPLSRWKRSTTFGGVMFFEREVKHQGTSKRTQKLASCIFVEASQKHKYIDPLFCVWNEHYEEFPHTREFCYRSIENEIAIKLMFQIHVPEKYNESTPSKEFGTSNLANFRLMSSATSNDKNLPSPLGMTSEKDSLASSLNFQAAEGSKYNIGPSSVHPKSSQMARKILEHLDRTVPSPKEKMVQLKLEKTGTKDFLNSACLAMDGREKRTDVSIIADDKPNSLSMDTAAAEEATTRLIMDNNHDKRPSITPNSTNQSILRAMEKTSEGFAFTFPVSTPINAPSQAPPTPTMTSSPAVCRMLSNTEDTIPSFTFSSPRADNGLVFSFGSISSPTLTDTTTLQFKFGSEKQRNLSFSSTSKDTYGLWVGS
ncbi:unnamed protein product [Musa acuminata subsp. malaccensis]|uniref:(wild Malaysian banana) hypothetical protein n=1 Tax=Musa acuminata subsp. malaccensis TaxID=214687 RepID=A0A8D7AYA1_MUSAM|nr:unnamed protein product [Musa acuminata subsp. malaccensis]